MKNPLPERRHPGLLPPARALAASLLGWSRFVAWRALNPATREPWLDSERPPALRRLRYRADDGWEAPLLVVPGLPGGSGEPVVVLHALGAAPDLYRYGRHALAASLRDAGLAVFLASHRGDPEADGPGPARFDDVVERDLPALLERVCAETGARAAHVVGHGLGGQAALAAAGRFSSHRMASVVAIGAAVRFTRARTELARLSRVAAALPAGWRVPLSQVAPWLSPWGADAVTRGALHYGVDDPALGLVAQWSTWERVGSLCDATGLLDYREALRDARCPLLVVTAHDDLVCPPDAALGALETWGGSDAAVLAIPAPWGHHDVVVGEPLGKPLAAWVGARRSLAW